MVNTFSDKLNKHNDKDQSNKILPGFENINRFWCHNMNIEMVKILPGEFYVTRSDEIIATVLGSCVSVCICDRKNGVGGMNHFMLPEKITDSKEDSWNFSKADRAARYGVDAMELLINEILKNGGKKNNFEIKLTGGGKIMSQMNDIGGKNIKFIQHYLHMEGYDIETEDLGEIFPRKIRYFPRSGKLQVKKLRALHNDTVMSREQNYRKHLKEDKLDGDVELFE